MAEHHLEATLPYATRFILMDEGKIISDGKPENVMKYMNRNHIYEEAIPDMYKAQLTLEKAGIRFEKPFLNIHDAEFSVLNSMKKEADHA